MVLLAPSVPVPLAILGLTALCQSVMVTANMALVHFKTGEFDSVNVNLDGLANSVIPAPMIHCAGTFVHTFTVSMEVTASSTLVLCAEPDVPVCPATMETLASSLLVTLVSMVSAPYDLAWQNVSVIQAGLGHGVRTKHAEKEMNIVAALLAFMARTVTTMSVKTTVTRASVR